MFKNHYIAPPTRFSNSEDYSDIFKAMTKQEDSLCPKVNGKRVTDVQALATASGSYRDMLMSRLKPIAPTSQTSEIINDDADRLTSVVPRNMTRGQLKNFINNETEYLINQDYSPIHPEVEKTD